VKKDKDISENWLYKKLILEVWYFERECTVPESKVAYRLPSLIPAHCLLMSYHCKDFTLHHSHNGLRCDCVNGNNFIGLAFSELNKEDGNLKTFRKKTDSLT
jgi:hypothetical protein